MTIITMPGITSVIDNANMRLGCVAIGQYRFRAAADCTVEKPTLEIVDVRRTVGGSPRAVAALSAVTLGVVMQQNLFMDVVGPLVSSYESGYADGMDDGRAEVQQDLRRVMGMAA